MSIIYVAQNASAMDEQKYKQSSSDPIKYRRIAKTSQPPEILNCEVTYYPTKYNKNEPEISDDLQLCAIIWNCLTYCCINICRQKGFYYRPLHVEFYVGIPKNSNKSEIERTIMAHIVQSFSTDTDPIMASKLIIKHYKAAEISTNFKLENQLVLMHGENKLHEII